MDAKIAYPTSGQRLESSPHPNFTVQKFNIGREGAPLLVVDNVLGNPEALLKVAIGKHYGDVASYYPGFAPRRH